MSEQQKTFEQSTDAILTFEGKKRAWLSSPKPNMTQISSVWRKCEILSISSPYEKTRLELKLESGQVIKARCAEDVWIPNAKVGQKLIFRINCFDCGQNVFFNEITEWKL